MVREPYDQWLEEVTEKAAILDWLLTPTQGRQDRPPVIAREINRNWLTSLFSFRVWGTKDEFLNAAKNQMRKEGLLNE